MRNEWRIIEDFPNYFVNPLADVMNARNESLIRPSVVNSGVLSVVLFQGGIPHRRSLAKVVAETFVLKPTAWCNTPIHLDGERGNCQARNLMWRPRHIAIRYHRQVETFPTLQNPKPIINLDTGEIFPTIQHVAVRYGLIVNELVDCIIRGRPTWPDKLRFDFT
jgi:hypothetical protein